MGSTHVAFTFEVVGNSLDQLIEEADRAGRELFGEREFQIYEFEIVKTGDHVRGFYRANVHASLASNSLRAAT